MPLQPDSLYSTLANIQTKVRRLVRAPSVNQLSDADLNNYINTFILYDMPMHLRQFSLRTTLTFWTQPYQDVYSTTTANQTDPLYNFSNNYISVHDPVYIAGYQAFFSQSREQFYGIYPYVNTIASIGPTGNGVTVAFAGNINPNLNPPVANGGNQQTVLLRNNVMFDSIDVNGNAIILVDSPVNATTGNLIIPNNPATGNLYGTINYITGNFVVNFPVAPAAGQTINSQSVPLVSSRPQGLLYFQDQFIVRPVPDQSYRIDIEAYMRPTSLLLAADVPGYTTNGTVTQIAQWWQYIAYGSAKKIFEDRMDMESVALILPEYKKQEALTLRTTIDQITNERTATIYTESLSNGQGGFGWGGGQF